MTTRKIAAPVPDLSSPPVAAVETDLDAGADLSGAAVDLRDPRAVFSSQDERRRDARKDENLGAGHAGATDLSCKTGELEATHSGPKDLGCIITGNDGDLEETHTGPNDLRCKITRKGMYREATHAAPKDVDGCRFIEDYYNMLNNKPESLHSLYNKTCDVSWSLIKDSEYKMQSSKEISNLMTCPDKLEGVFRPKSQVLHPSKHTIHVVCQGVYTVDATRWNFVQSFVLHHRTKLILSDVLRIVSIVVKLSVKKTPSCAVEAKDRKDVMVVYNEECLLHIPTMKHKHPERPQRIHDIMASFRRDGVFERILFEGSDPALREHIVVVHGEDYLEFIDGLPSSAHDPKFAHFIDSLDMYASAGTKEAVYLAAGAVIKACDVVAKGLVQKAFALVRPPGHHAKPQFAEGFCYLNNAAIGAKFLQDVHKHEKVLLVDIDVHHGDGSQLIFYESDTTMFFSTHCNELKYPYQPKDIADNLSLKHTSIGDGKGSGFNINISMKSQFGDADILYALKNVLVPLVGVFKPNSIVVSAGFDAAFGDSVGGCCLTKKCYGTMANMLVELGKGKLVTCLEGGYGSLSLGDCVSYWVRSLYGDKEARYTQEELDALAPPRDDTVKAVKFVKKLLMEQWPEGIRLDPPLPLPTLPRRLRPRPSRPLS